MAQTNTKTLELYIGLFIVAAVIVVSGLIIVFGQTSLLFSDTYVVLVDIEHISDLQEGAPVKLGGVRIGTVSSIQLDPEKGKNVELTCTIDAGVPLPVDSSATIANSGLVGDTFLEFIRGKSQDVLPSSVQTADAFKTWLKENNYDFEALDGEGQVPMGRIFNQLQEIGTEVIALTRNVNDIVGDPKVKKDIRETIANVNATSNEAKRLLASLRKSSEKVYTASQDIAETTERVKAMSATIQEAVNKTLGDPKNVEAINQAIANAKEISANAQSLLARVDKLVEDEEAHIKDVVGNIRDVTGKAKEIVEAVDTKQVGEAVNKLTAAINDAQAFIATVRREIAIALVINKGADRIVDQKFKEMNQRGEDTRHNADEQLGEFNRWVKEHLRKGAFDDPMYEKLEDRPYHDVGKEE